MTAFNTTNNPIHNQIGDMAPLPSGKSRKTNAGYDQYICVSIDLGVFHEHLGMIDNPTIFYADSKTYPSEHTDQLSPGIWVQDMRPLSQ